MRIKMIKRVLCTLAVILCFSSNFAHAGIIYQNVADENYTAIGGSTIGTEQGYTKSIQFTAGLTEYLDKISVQLWNSGANNIFDIYLLTDNGGTIGSLIQGVMGQTTAVAWSDSTPLVEVDFGNSTLLTAGTDYWITISAGYDDTWLAWEIADQSNGLRVIGTAASVPEPTTYLLMALGLVGLLVRSIRGK